MKKSPFIVLCFSILVVFSCKQTNEEASIEPKIETKPINLAPKEDSLQIDFPEISVNSTPTEIKKVIEETVATIDQSLSKLKKKEGAITLYQIPNTPLTIWYYNNSPIKIEHGVANDSGKIESTFKYYLNENGVWYSDQLFAKYIFQNQELIFWMDSEWNVNEIPVENFKAREKHLRETVQFLISQI